MRIAFRKSRYAVAVALTTTALAVSGTGCAVSLDRLPLPAPGLGSDSYQLTATFANALNLPTKAKVKLEGDDVGQVESMSARDYAATVTMRIRSAVRLPVGTTAELRSATPMGDVFVAMTPSAQPNDGGATLRDGANIPIESTSAAATVEEVLSRASLLVSGGAIENLTRLVTSLGQRLDGRGDRLATTVSETRGLLHTLATRSDQINGVLADADQLGTDLAAQQPAITDAVAAAEPALTVVGDNTETIIDLVARIHTITQQLERFPSIQGTNNGSITADIDLMAKGLDAAANNPRASLDSLNNTLETILKVTSASSSHVDADIAQIAVGAVPDPNFPGTPGGRLPEAADWTRFVGSLQHMLARLDGRLNGPPR